MTCREIERLPLSACSTATCCMQMYEAKLNAHPRRRVVQEGELVLNECCHGVRDCHIHLEQGIVQGSVLCDARLIARSTGTVANCVAQ